MESIDTITSVNNRYAYIYENEGSPIYNAKQMLPDKPLVCLPLDEEWQKRLNAQMWWSSGYTGNEHGTPDDMALIKKLLSFGGYEACVQYQESDAKNILERGQLWYGDRTAFRKGAPCDCHRNSCNLWKQNCADHEVAIATGYALTKDGMWRQHSWLLRRKPRSVRLVETTTERIAYFGFVMTEEEAKQFCSANL